MSTEEIGVLFDKVVKRAVLMESDEDIQGMAKALGVTLPEYLRARLIVMTARKPWVADTPAFMAYHLIIWMHENGLGRVSTHLEKSAALRALDRKHSDPGGQSG